MFYQVLGIAQVGYECGGVVNGICYMILISKEKMLHGLPVILVGCTFYL